MIDLNFEPVSWFALILAYLLVLLFSGLIMRNMKERSLARLLGVLKQSGKTEKEIYQEFKRLRQCDSIELTVIEHILELKGIDVSVVRQESTHDKSPK